MTTVSNSADTAALFRQAEVRAEGVVGRLRMIVVLGLGILFVLAVFRPGFQPDNVLIRQWIYAGVSMAAYFALGLLSWLLVARDRLRPWMIWPIATGDCLFLLASAWLGLNNTGLGGAYVFVLPSLWTVPLVLAFGVLRFNPAIQAYVALVSVIGLFLLFWLVPSRSAEPDMNDVALFLSVPPNLMRLSMLALAGVVLVTAAIRTRALLLHSIRETQRSVNLTRYLPAQLAPRLAQGGLDELRRGKRQNMAVLFVDMRGFTSWSETRSPQEISTFMTEFRKCITRVADAKGGIIDKFMGDAAMILFEDESAPTRAAQSGVACAEALCRAFSQWSQERQARGDPPVQVGIGLHWGEVFSGVVGDPDRLEYSVFGDAVNIAARLEEATKTYSMPIVASRDVLDQAGVGRDSGDWVPLADAAIRGRIGNVEIFGRAPALLDR